MKNMLIIAFILNIILLLGLTVFVYAQEATPEDSCTALGYKCTSAVRGCGLNYEQLDYDCGDPNVICCEDTSYCGDGICDTEIAYPNPESEANCPEDCGTKAGMTPYDESGGKVGYEVEIQLYKGWNLIPALCNSGIDEIKAANIETMYFLNPNTNEYLNTYHNGKFMNEQELGPFEEQVCSSSQWVFVSESNTFRYRPDHLPKLEDKQINKGWNFLIVTPEFKGKPIEQIKGDCDISRLYFYNAEEDEIQHWKAIPLDFAIPDYIVGLNLVVKTTNNCHMGSLEEPIGAPPPIPT
tara:strand:- start:192 stop:1079 length:888 start_codon:yes stop_codon:yes gene_type:complete